MKNFINVTIQLADKRILTSKELLAGNKESKWGITTGRSIERDALSAFGKIMWELFAVDVITYDDSFADMKRLGPIFLAGHVAKITPFIVKMQKPFMFKTQVKRLFRAAKWEDILKEIMQDTIYVSPNVAPAHTVIAMETSRELHIKGTFDE